MANIWKTIISSYLCNWFPVNCIRPKLLNLQFGGIFFDEFLHSVFWGKNKYKFLDKLSPKNNFRCKMYLTIMHHNRWF
jgi:hypothetical protein